MKFCFQIELQEQIDEIRSWKAFLLPRQEKRLKKNIIYFETKTKEDKKVKAEIRLAKADPAYLNDEDIRILEQKMKPMENIFRKIQTSVQTTARF